MGFYVQDDYWEAVAGLPVKAQTEILGSLARYYFTGEEPHLQPAYQGIFIMGRQRVDMSRDKAERKARERARQSCDGEETVVRQSCDSRVTLLNREGERDKENSPDGELKKARFIPPTFEDVREYCEARGNGVDARRFVDFYQSKGWMVGRTRMKDWKAAVRTWERKEAKKDDDPGFSFEFAQ